MLVPARRHLKPNNHEGVLCFPAVHVDVEIEMVVDRISDAVISRLDENSTDGITVIVLHFVFLVRHAHHSREVIDENLSSVLVVNEVDKHVNLLFIVILFSDNNT